MGLAIKMGATTPIVVETILWENPDPTANFSAQAVPVTQSVLNFDSIRVYFYNTTSLSIGPTYVEIDSSQYDLFLKESSKMRFCIGYCTSDADSYSRFCSINGDSLYIGTCKLYNSTTTHNNIAIPYRVTGISKKEILIPSRGNETVKVLWTNPSPDSAMAADTEITLSEGLENYDLVRIMWKASTTDEVDVNSWADWHIGKDPTRFRSTTNNERITISASSTGTTSYVRNCTMVSTTEPYNTVRFSNGCRVANTTTNTSYVIPLVIYGVNFEQ